MQPVDRSGIYEIRNTVNGKRYIGSAVRFKSRWHSHRILLRKGKHHSRHLQFAWLKYGEDAFEFRPILICAKHNLLVYEQAALDAYKPEYNVATAAGSLLGFKHSAASIEAMRKRVWSAEHRAKLAAASAGRKLGDASRAAMSLAHRGKRPSDATRAKMAAARAGKRPASGMRHSLEFRAKMSAAMKLRNALHPIFHSEETKAKLRLQKLGKPGRTHTEASRAKISEALRGNKIWTGRSHSAESKMKISAAHRGRVFSIEHRQALSLSHKGKTPSQETREKMSAAKTGRTLPEAHKAACRAGWARRRETVRE